MKKITVISVVKNSADIIETFIRCNSLFADNFVIVNNGSTDRTLEILSLLSQEGFNITVFDDEDSAHLQSMRMNLVVQWLYQNDSPDWVVPLDDDEILFSIDESKSVRETIEELDDDKLYYSKWRIYIPSDCEDDDSVSTPLKQHMCFDDSHETNYKVLLSKKILTKYETLIQQGNHDVVGCDAEKIILDTLKIAHYPARSKAQVEAKALVGWTNTMAIPNHRTDNGYHRKKMYDVVKSKGKITLEMLWEACAVYVEDFNQREPVIVDNPILLDDENVFNLKYTHEHEVDPWLNYINNTEKLAQNYKKLKEQRN